MNMLWFLLAWGMEMNLTACESNCVRIARCADAYAKGGIGVWHGDLDYLREHSKKCKMYTL